MRITVKCFASSREIVGQHELVIDVRVGATVADLRDVLFETYPRLIDLRLRFAVNAVYAAQEVELHAGDEVACIPPVGGG
ncbi:MAG: MoaD/ThiS family protein [Anaerolineae bacterium]|nr:MoaD/ThiS family protein [Anaerolineae bacterium]